MTNKWQKKELLRFFYKQDFCKQQPETELLLFENYSLSSSMLSSKTNMRYSKKCTRNKCICFD